MIDLQLVIQNLPSAVIVVDDDRRVRLSNVMAQQFSGLSAQQMVAKRGGDVLGCRHAGESPQGCGFSRNCQICQVKQAVEKAFADGGIVKPFETQVDIQALGPRCFKVTVTYLAGRRRRPADPDDLALITLDDISDIKSNERLAAAHATIGAVCHEMNQPLMAIMGYSELLMIDNRHGELLPELLAQITRLGDITRKMQSLTTYSTKPYLDLRHGIRDLEASSRAS